MFSVKMRYSVYWSSHYGSQLWEITNLRIEDHCVVWRKGLREIWKLPDCDSNCVGSIVLNGISAGMNSLIGRNVIHCSAHFNLRIECIGVSKLHEQQ